MKNHLKLYQIPDSLDAARAFAKSISGTYVHPSLRNSDYIPSIQPAEEFRKMGWQIVGAKDWSRNGQPVRNTIQMTHPDFSDSESKLNLFIDNSATGTQPMTMSLGLLRLVCSNGLIAFRENATAYIRHQAGVDLQSYIDVLNSQAAEIHKDFAQMKDVVLTPTQIEEFAKAAIAKRYQLSLEEEANINVTPFLTVRRAEDEGRELWKVFNRLQENLSLDLQDSVEYITFNQDISSLASTLVTA
jgi:hypothetical protein